MHFGRRGARSPERVEVNNAIIDQILGNVGSSNSRPLLELGSGDAAVNSVSAELERIRCELRTHVTDS